MVSLLLAIIYLAFISLGLPDSLLGSIWSIAHKELEVGLSYMGYITIIISCGTVVSSLFADKLNNKLSTGVVVFISVLLTALGLFGFSISSEYYMLLLFAIPYGLGAGAIDASLNNYVALHYSSRHMSWLHCFWGIGTLVGPFVMTYALTCKNNWHDGYLIISIIQFSLAFIMLLALPLWKNVKHNNKIEVKEEKQEALKFKEKLKIKGIWFLLIGFFCYSAIETVVMGWASTYMVRAKGIDTTTAATFASFFFIGMTVGRFICGFVSSKLGDKKMIRIGYAVLFVGIILISLPINEIALPGFIVIGLGCSPIYPSIIHSTPSNFERKYSQAIIGLEMAGAYVASISMPYAFGLLADFITIEIMPIYLLLFSAISIIMLELLVKNRKNNSIINE